MVINKTKTLTTKPSNFDPFTEQLTTLYEVIGSHLQLAESQLTQANTLWRRLKQYQIQLDTNLRQLITDIAQNHLAKQSSFTLDTLHNLYNWDCNQLAQLAAQHIEEPTHILLTFVHQLKTWQSICNICIQSLLPNDDPLLTSSNLIKQFNDELIAQHVSLQAAIKAARSPDIIKAARALHQTADSEAAANQLPPTQHLHQLRRLTELQAGTIAALLQELELMQQKTSVVPKRNEAAFQKLRNNLAPLAESKAACRSRLFDTSSSFDKNWEQLLEIQNKLLDQILLCSIHPIPQVLKTQIELLGQTAKTGSSVKSQRQQTENAIKEQTQLAEATYQLVTTAEPQPYPTEQAKAPDQVNIQQPNTVKDYRIYGIYASSIAHLDYLYDQLMAATKVARHAKATDQSSQTDLAAIKTQLELLTQPFESHIRILKYTATQKHPNKTLLNYTNELNTYLSSAGLAFYSPEEKAKNLLEKLGITTTLNDLTQASHEKIESLYEDVNRLLQAVATHVATLENHKKIWETSTQTVPQLAIKNDGVNDHFPHVHQQKIQAINHILLQTHETLQTHSRIFGLNEVGKTIATITSQHVFHYCWELFTCLVQLCNTLLLLPIHQKANKLYQNYLASSETNDQTSSGHSARNPSKQQGNIHTKTTADEPSTCNTEWLMRKQFLIARLVQTLCSQLHHNYINKRITNGFSLQSATVAHNNLWRNTKLLKAKVQVAFHVLGQPYIEKNLSNSQYQSSTTTSRNAQFETTCEVIKKQNPNTKFSMFRKQGLSDVAQTLQYMLKQGLAYTESHATHYYDQLNYTLRLAIQWNKLEEQKAKKTYYITSSNLHTELTHMQQQLTRFCRMNEQRVQDYFKEHPTILQEYINLRQNRSDLAPGFTSTTETKSDPSPVS